MRKVETVVVPAWGTRDDGRVFTITEMPAAQAEKWAWRMFVALKGTSGEVSKELAQLGMVGVAIAGLNAFLQAPVAFGEIEPLLDEMFTCVRIVRDPNHPDKATPLIDGDIEEVQTRGWLRSEVLRVHTGFSIAEAISTWRASAPTSQGSPSI